MCPHDDPQHHPYPSAIPSMATEDPIGNRRPPQLNITIVGRRCNCQHELDKVETAATGEPTLAASLTAHVKEIVKYELRKGNNFQLAPGPDEPLADGEDNRDSAVLDLVIRQLVVKAPSSSVSVQASEPHEMSAEHVDLNDPNPQDLAVFGTGFWTSE